MNAGLLVEMVIVGPEEGRDRAGAWCYRRDWRKK